MFGSCKPAFLEDDRIFQFLHHGHSNTDKTAFHKIHFLNINTNYKFLLPPSEARESENIKKRGGSMVQGQVFLKEGESWHFIYLIFSRFIIFTLRNYFTKSSSAAGRSQHQLTSAADISQHQQPPSGASCS